MTMSRFFTLKYYFTPLPDPNFQYTKLVLGVAFLLIAGALVLGMVRRRKVKDEVLRKMLRPYGNVARTFGLLLLVLLFFREAGVPYLASRFWWVLWAGWLLYYTIKEAITFKARYHARVTSREQSAAKKSYLPTRKRRK